MDGLRLALEFQSHWETTLFEGVRAVPAGTFFRCSIAAPTDSAVVS